MVGFISASGTNFCSSLAAFRGAGAIERNGGRRWTASGPLAAFISRVVSIRLSTIVQRSAVYRGGGNRNETRRGHDDEISAGPFGRKVGSTFIGG